MINNSTFQSEMWKPFEDKYLNTILSLPKPTWTTLLSPKVTESIGLKSKFAYKYLGLVENFFTLVVYWAITEKLK